MINDELAAEDEIESVIENEGDAPAASNGDDAPADIIEGEETEVEITAEGEEAETANTDETENPTEKAEPKKGKSGYQKRIDKLVHQVRERDRFIVDMQERVLAEQNLAQQQVPATNDGPPVRESFDDYEEYVKAAAVHEVRQEMAQDKKTGIEAQQTQRQQQAQAQLLHVRDAALDAGSALYDDFEAVATSESLSLTSAMAEAVLSVENAPVVWYHLGKNPDKAAEIASKSPMQQVLDVAKLASTLGSVPSKKPSSAPKPATPIKTRAAPQSGPSDKQDMAAWMAARNKKLYG